MVTGGEALGAFIQAAGHQDRIQVSIQDSIC